MSAGSGCLTTLGVSGKDVARKAEQTTGHSVAYAVERTARLLQWGDAGVERAVSGLAGPVWLQETGAEREETGGAGMVSWSEAERRRRPRGSGGKLFWLASIRHKNFLT